MLGDLDFGFDVVAVWAQLFDRGGNFCDHIDKLGRFGGGNPRKLQSFGLDAHVFHQVLEQGELSTGVVITFQVMAFAGMSPGHPDAVRTLY